MAVFNIETQIWKPEKKLPDTMWGHEWTGECVVMAGKMYTRDPIKSIVYVYDPKENKWETDKMLNIFDWENASVVDDVLYYYDALWKMMRAYNPRERNW
ncbi:hypothetical protein Bca52824_080053 [Brassica carinata]|uniref:FKB95-like N-terminal Kelch domain-containing protein n=1 Tax=Brassica carinata TaxID=52824 RepID=A0A8X7U0P3_BRACI|nr:hypothetical protein Bca52824_080053 [Brassica carinata]